MAEIDVLTEMMSESKVDPASLGQHPRYSMFKNATKAAEQQADRRREALERQRERRIDAHNHLRNLAECLESDEEADDSLPTDDSTQNLAKTLTRKLRYANELMTSEWLVDIPEKLSEEWIMVPSPVGRRTLVVATNGVTTAYSKNGRLMHQFKSKLPCRNNKYTILDCILVEHIFYILDILAWNSNVYSDLPFDNRLFWLKSHIMESPELKISSKSCKYTFHELPSCYCNKTEMETFMRSEFDFELDGLLFYYSQVLYTPGQSPLVGWLKPFMLKEILNVEIPERFMAANKDKLSSTQFIEQFNKKYKHTSQISKDDEMKTLE